jgi:hypothetical protein
MARDLDPQVTEAIRVLFFFWEGGERWVFDIHNLHVLHVTCQLVSRLCSIHSLLSL